MKDKRTFLIVVSIVILTTLIFSACAGATPEPTQAPEETEAPAVETEEPMAETEEPMVETEEPMAETEEPVAEGMSFEGTELNFFAQTTLYQASGADDGLFKEWQDASGATVNVALFDAAGLREKLLVEFAADSDAFDAAFFNYAWFNSTFTQYFEPLDDYVTQTDAEYDFDDIFTSLVDSSKADGQLVAIPFRIGSSMLYYRTDLMEAAGIEVPQTWDDFYAAAEMLTQDTDGDGQVDVYGAVQRGKPGYELSQDFLRYLFGYGGNLLNEDMTACVMDDEAAVSTLTLWVDLFQNGYMAPDMQAFGRDEYLAEMQQGRAAMGIYFSPYWGSLIGADSTVADQMGWALVPHADGVAPGRSQNAGWSLIINVNSNNKDAAWDLIKYLTTKDAQLRAARDWGNGPIRESVYENEEYLELFPLAIDWKDAIANSLFEPPLDTYPQMQDIMSEEVIAALNLEKTPQEALTSACERIDLLLE